MPDDDDDDEAMMPLEDVDCGLSSGDIEELEGVVEGVTCMAEAAELEAAEEVEEEGGILDLDGVDMGSFGGERRGLIGGGTAD